MTSAASDLDLEVAAARSWDDECAVADDLDAYPGGAMSSPAGDALADSDPAASLELRHGYTLDSLNRLAHFAARRKRWHGGAELPARYEVA